MASGELAGFADVVRRAIPRVEADGRFGRKVFVASLWRASHEIVGPRISLEQFKAQLFAAHRAQLLTLCRADLVAAMPAASVAASEVVRDGATFHFVVDPTARDPWA